MSTAGIRKEKIRRCAALSQIFLAYIPSMLFVFALVALSLQSHLVLLLLLAPFFLLVGALIATYGVLRLRCWHCEKRFFSALYPTWPFQDRCDHCCTAINEPDQAL
ncbi:MAG: hypothetical protein QM690_01655 [Sphingobium sp.]